VWFFIPVIPALGEAEARDGEFKASLYSETLSQKTATKKEKEDANSSPLNMGWAPFQLIE
jgi:hypothetical protein